MTTGQEAPFDPASADVPVYATQGGGYATYLNGTFVWFGEIPDFMVDLGAKLGDPIPEEWGTAAANQAAQDEMNRELYDDDEPWY